MNRKDELLDDIRSHVATALHEDLGNGDLTAQLIPIAAEATARVTSRDTMTLSGAPWVDEVCRQVDENIAVSWQADDGDIVDAGAILCELRGPARAILSAERTALNYLQLLSAVATATAKYVDAVSGTSCRILDTRKTIPGLRLAQKYAVTCGGGLNHRLGLFDAILIKENHIVSAGGIKAAVEIARAHHGKMPVEVEVESIDELREALSAQAERLLLDNFSIQLLKEAVAINRSDGAPPAELEASGGISLTNVAAIAATGVDFVSIGALTKDIRAVDLSMRFD